MSLVACPHGLAKEQIRRKCCSLNGTFGDAAAFSDADVHVKELVWDEGGAEFGIADVFTDLHHYPPPTRWAEGTPAMRAHPKRSMKMTAPVFGFSIMSAFTSSEASSNFPTGNFSPGGFQRQIKGLSNSLVVVAIVSGFGDG